MDGLVIGKYRVTGKLGEGGMAVVYLATHELLGREAAIKLLQPEMCANDGIVQRFLREAQAAARIRHPGIVEVYDVGYTDSGQAFIVMERLHGETLTRRVQRVGRLPVDEALTVTRQLASVVGAAHAQGIVHRDLKPDNIFVVADPDIASGERVKVLDFGLAKLAEHAVTGVGSVFGTPSYMAPEQCRNAAGVDARADIYSIGCIMYRLLAGRPPFGSGGADFLAVLRSHLTEPPTPLRSRDPAIPRWLDALVMQLLDKNPARRPASCEALIAQLDANADGTDTIVSMPRATAQAVTLVVPHGEPADPPRAEPARASTEEAGAAELRTLVYPRRPTLPGSAPSFKGGEVQPRSPSANTRPPVLVSVVAMFALGAGFGGLVRWLDRDSEVAAQFAARADARDVAPRADARSEPDAEPEYQPDAAAVEAARLAPLREAAEAGDLDAARAAFDALGEEPPAEARDILARAREGWLLARAREARDARNLLRCRDVRAALAAVTERVPERAAAFEQIYEACVRQTREALAALEADIAKTYQQQRHGETSKLCAKARRLGLRDARVIAKCVMATCRIGEHALARRLLKRAAEPDLPGLRRFCTPYGATFDP